MLWRALAFLQLDIQAFPIWGSFREGIMSEEIESKSGTELFKELLRLYKTAEVEDYYKMGQWQDERMKIDIGLLEAHRKEGGAPDAPELEEVVMPDNLPGTGPAATFPGLMKPNLMAPGGLAVAQPAAAQAGGGPVAELRQIALFVTKWKLEPNKAKLLLAKQTPNRRRYIIANFSTQSSGDQAVTELEGYLAACEKDGSWDKVTMAAPAPVAAVAPRPVLSLNAAVAGVKRPLSPAPGGNPLFDPSKRPALGGMLAPNVVPARAPSPNPAAAQSLAARIAAARGLATPGTAPGVGVFPGGPRPVAPRPAWAAPGQVPPNQAGNTLIRNLLQKF